MSPRRAVVGLMAIAGALTACPGGAAAATSRGYTITRSTDLIVVSRDGYAQYQRNAAGRRTSGILIDYRRGRVTLVDVAGRRFQTVALKALAARLLEGRRQLRHIDTPYFALPDGVAAPRERLTRLHATRRIKGLRARAYRLQRSRQAPSRLWFSAALPRPPAAVAAVMARFSAGGARALAGNVALRAEQRVGRRWRVEATTRRVRAGRVSRSSFRAPKGFAATTELVPPITAAPSSVGAHVRRQASFWPIQHQPQIFAIYEGARFASEPETVRRLDAALAGTILQRPYIDGMAQYGVGPGRFLGHMVIAHDPPFVAGQTTANGWSQNAGIAQRARFSGAPYAWSRLGPDPLVVIFMPAEAVDPANNRGYHSVMPVETALLDPLGALLLQVYPFAIVKVPPADPAFAYIDTATQIASHETVETATDPVPMPAGFVDPAKNDLVPAEGVEIGDICQEGNTAPWSMFSRVGGVGVATYWSEDTHSCVPESRPAVSIATPADGTTIHRGQPVTFIADATDVWTGMTPGTLTWTSTLDGDLGGGTNVTPALSVGTHNIRVTATGTGNATRSATITVHVDSLPPAVHVTRPLGGADYPSDGLIPFHGSATDVADGALSGDALTWSLDGVEIGHGTGFGRQMAAGTHTASLRAVNAHGESATAAVTFSVGAPTGGPSVLIDVPEDGQSFPAGKPVDFSGHGSDVQDKTLKDAQLQWFDDAAGKPSVNFGSGPSASAVLAPGAHTIRLVVTDTDGHEAADAIEVTSG